jgi:hypothetical protein
MFTHDNIAPSTIISMLSCLRGMETVCRLFRSLDFKVLETTLASHELPVNAISCFCSSCNIGQVRRGLIHDTRPFLEHDQDHDNFRGFFSYEANEN